MKHSLYPICCTLAILTVAVCFFDGCAPKTGKTTRDIGALKPRGESAPMTSAPAVPFEADENGNVNVDLARCPALADNQSIVVVEKTALGRPILLTHLTDNIYYALDSRCDGDKCIAIATPNEIICPCDSTRYDFSGAAIKGPGGLPLRELPSLLNGNQIHISLK